MSTSAETACLVLRLAGVLQSWGGPSQYSWRETQPQPSKSGIVGLLAAAEGRPREATIADLTELRLGVRTDQPGRLLRDFHTVADYRGRPLPSAKVNKQGRQEPRTGKDRLAPLVTHRFYLQDAVFTVAVSGERGLVERLAHAVRHPVFPLALGRRGCPPSQPIYHSTHEGPDAAEPEAVLAQTPWQATGHIRRRAAGASIALPVIVDDPAGAETLNDVPLTFDLTKPGQRASRRIRRGWITVPTDRKSNTDQSTPDDHDPFSLLGW